MRILWICNICIPIIAKHLHAEASPKEGWLSGMADEILHHHAETDIELGICFPAPSPDYDFYASSDVAEGLTVYGFGTKLLQAEVYDEILEKRFRQILEDFRPDVLHIFGTEYPHALAAEKAFGRPERTLVGIQGVCALCGAKYLEGIPSKVKNGASFRDILKKDSLRRQQVKFLQRGEREQSVLRGAAHVAGRTAFDASYAAAVNPGAAYHLLRENLRAEFYEGAWAAESCTPHSVFVSQADYALKGFHDLVKAAGELQKKYPDLTVRVAGTSLVKYTTVKERLKITGYGKYLRKLMKKEGLEGRVTFLGPLTAEQMKAEYLRASVFVCCSLLENSPNSLGEAMLLKVPCVAPAVGGIPDLLESGREGLLYESYDPRGTETSLYFEKTLQAAALLREQGAGKKSLKTVKELFPGREKDSVWQGLAQCLDEIWSNPEKTAAFGEAASLHARKTHHRSENLQQLLEVYRSIAEKQ